MKINVTVDLEDFYNNDDELSFSEQIKNYVASVVKGDVLSDWREKISKEFSEQIREAISQEKDRLITTTIEELIATEKLQRSPYSKEMVPIRDFAIETLKGWWLSDSGATNSFNKLLQKESERISEDLKKRYDLMFASQIITKLNENGMLKDDVAKLILG